MDDWARWLGDSIGRPQKPSTPLSTMGMQDSYHTTSGSSAIIRRSHTKLIFTIVVILSFVGFLLTFIDVCLCLFLFLYFALLRQCADKGHYITGQLTAPYSWTISKCKAAYCIASSVCWHQIVICDARWRLLSQLSLNVCNLAILGEFQLFDVYSIHLNNILHLVVIVFGMHLYECTAPLIANNLQSGQF